MSNNSVGEYDSRTLMRENLKWQVVGLSLMVVHVLLVKLSLIFYPVVMLLVAQLYVRASLAALLVFFQLLIYQNVIISLFDADMSFQTFQALQGTNFVALLMMGSLAGLRLLPHRRQHQAIVTSVIIALLAASAYTIVGLEAAGVGPAIAYFRSFTAAIFACLVGLDVGRTWSFRTIGRCLLYAAALALLLSLVEYFYSNEYYTIINAVKFYQLKYWNVPKGNTFYTPAQIVAQFTSVFFNISGSVHNEYGFDNFRFGGTIVNPISNAYIMSVLAITAIALRRGKWLLLLLPMLVLAGSKGPVLLLMLSVVAYWIWITTRSRSLLLLGSLCLAIAYISIGILFGLRTDDYHVLGLLGGVRSLLQTPIGHGLGVGGNISTIAANFDMSNEGAALKSANFDFALESAVGVLFYQMGLASVAVLSVFGAFLWKAPLGGTKLFCLPHRSDIMFFAVGTVVVNGVFQEEAFAPYASGLIMLLAGVLFGNQRQVGQVVLPTRLGAHRPHSLLATAGLALGLLLSCGTPSWAVSADRLATMRRGANITTTFEQNKDLDLDLTRLASIGFTHVRVFVVAESLNSAPYLQRLDRLVAQVIRHHMGIVLCMTSAIHPWTDKTDPEIVWAEAWRRLAVRLRPSPPQYVFLELANEPAISDSEKWDRLQDRLRQEIRNMLPQHTILLTGSPTSTVWSLVEHPVAANRDPNIIYSFHLYQPMAVTCQGCDCCPDDRLIHDLKYPPEAANIVRITTPATATILEAYRQNGAAMLRREIDAASAWSTTHGVPVVATEFGIFSAASEQTRAAWLHEARSKLEDAGIGWTVWEWKGGFGVAPLFPHTPLIEALGLDH